MAKLHEAGAFKNMGAARAPEVVAPDKPGAIPANWYTRFIKEAVDKDGVTFAERIKRLTVDPRFNADDDRAADTWKARELDRLREDIEDAAMPAALLKDIEEQVAAPYVKAHPRLRRARLRSSVPVMEDGGQGKLPNMAGAFDSNTARWERGANAKATLRNATLAIAEAMREDYASVFNDRAIAEMQWHNVDLDEESMAMALAITPNEDDEIANGVVRVNKDLAGFFSITADAQYGEQLVTNPEGGAIPDTFVAGNYDVLDGKVVVDIGYERESNLKPTDSKRKHAFTDKEILAVYDTMKLLRDHFAGLQGIDPADYQNECEIKVTEKGQVLFKQERPWVD
jgi:hypothetical protein